MKDELQDLLKEVLGKWREKGADPSTLCTNLWFGDHISNDEYDIINSKTSRSDKFLEIIRRLNPKNEEVFKKLQEICIEEDWKDLYDTIQNGLTKIEGCSHLKMTPEQLFKIKSHYKVKSSYLNRREEKQRIVFGEKNPVIDFVGRKRQLKGLHTILNSCTVKKWAIITGLGGIGKTQLALKYVQLYRQKYDNNTIWINAERDAILRNSLINLAENLKINIKHANGVEKETARILQDVYAHFSMVKCLFVFDNADEPLKDNFYPNSQLEIFVLITSRYQKWGKINVLHLNNFTPEEASEFIRISLKIDAGDSKEQMAHLANMLYYFPLALNQATAYINKTREIKKTYSIDDYTKEYNESKESLLSYKFNSDYGNEQQQHNETTFTTWKITIDKLKGNNWVQKLMERFLFFKKKTVGNLAIAILDCISYFAHEQIDKQIFVQRENSEEIDVAVRLLKDYSLVTEENDLLNVHPLVQEVTRLNIEKKKAEKETFITACRLVVSYFKRLNQTNDFHKQKILLLLSEKLLQEMKSWLIKNDSQKKHIEQEYIKGLLTQMKVAYFNCGQQWQSKSVLEHLLSIVEEEFGPDDYEVATILAALGIAYGTVKQHEKTKTSLERALAIMEKHYGPDGYDIAISLMNLSNVYGELEQPEKQKTLLEKALPILEKHYGPDHYEVAKALVNLSNACRALGETEKQKTLAEKALAIKEKHYGQDHYEVAIALVSLSNAYHALGQPEKQKTLLEKALLIQEKHYGPDHYEIATTLVNLSVACRSLGQPEKQKTLAKKALPILEKHYGSQHYEIADAFVNLSSAYAALGQPEKQKIMLEKALSIRKKHYGPDHYKVAETLVNLSSAYAALGQPEKKKIMLEKALSIQEKHYGPYHYEVAIILVNLSVACGALGRPEKQKTLAEKALPILEKHYGQDHYKVAITLIVLSNAYGALGQPEKQKTFAEKALAINEKHYGPDHYEVGITLVILSDAYEGLRQPEKQKELLEEALVILEKHYGPDHYEVAKTLVNLSNAYGALGQPEKQKTLLEKALVVIIRHIVKAVKK